MNKDNELLFKAIEHVDFEKVKLLVEAEVNVNIKNSFGNSPLHRACAAKNFAIAKLLVEARADVNQLNNDNSTPLHFAALYGQEKIVEIFIKAGAKVDLKNDLGDTPLHCAASRGNIKAAQYLIEAGSELDILNKSGQTPLILAVESDKQEMISLLNLHGSDFFKLSFNDLIKQPPYYIQIWEKWLRENCLTKDYVSIGSEILNHILLFRALIYLESDNSITFSSDIKINKPYLVIDAASIIQEINGYTGKDIPIKAIINNLVKFSKEIEYKGQLNPYFKFKLEIKSALSKVRDYFLEKIINDKKEFLSSWPLKLVYAKIPLDKKEDKTDNHKPIAKEDEFPLYNLPEELINKIGKYVYYNLKSNKYLIDGKGIIAGQSIKDLAAIEGALLNEWKQSDVPATELIGKVEEVS
jgi:ankyrin repeat protein